MSKYKIIESKSYDDDIEIENIDTELKALHIVDTENDDRIEMSFISMDGQIPENDLNHIDDCLELFNKNIDEIKDIIKDMEDVIYNDRHKYDEINEEYDSGDYNIDKIGGYDAGYDSGLEDGINLLNNYIIKLKELIN